jgi:hypothetical protein
MTASALAPVPSLADRMQDLLERVEYRRAETDEDKEAIYRLRCESYLREGAIAPRFTKLFADDDDEAKNAWIIGVYIDGRLASSVRLHVASRHCPDSPSARVFPEHVAPELEAGKTIIDPTRFVADHAVARACSELPYLTLRAAYLSAEHFGADLVLATVRAEHQAFYKRVFGHRPVCPPRDYPSLAKPISLMTLPFPAEKHNILRRYPFFGSTFDERRMLFDRNGEAARLAA